WRAWPRESPSPRPTSRSRSTACTSSQSPGGTMAPRLRIAVAVSVSAALAGATIRSAVAQTAAPRAAAAMDALSPARVAAVRAYGETDKARDMVENFLYEIEHYGTVLNANRTYYLTRSQPPFLTVMVLGVFHKTGDKEWLRRTVPAIDAYYRFWTTEPHVIP